MNIFTITAWDELTQTEYEGKKLTHAKVKQAYSGILKGDAQIEYQMIYTSESEASYIGTELFTGELEGKTGTFVLVHRGTFKQGKVHSRFDVIEGSGTGELSGIRGQGEFASGDEQSVNYSFEYTLLAS